jgi:hypothetical protein
MDCTHVFYTGLGQSTEELSLYILPMLEFRELLCWKISLLERHGMEVLNRTLLLLPSHIPGLCVLGK